MKHKFFWLVVIAAVLAGGYFYKTSRKPKVENNQSGPEQQSSSDRQNQTIADQSGQLGNTLVGTLKVSNDKKRGNLMLELADSDRVIYMTSSRDFFALFNKDVVVTIDGDLTGFRLIDIKAKQ